MRVCDAVHRHSRGETLIEVLIGLAILGLIATAFLGAIYTSRQAARVADERANAQAIAQTQMEHLKSLDYDETNNPPLYTLSTELTSLPEEYGVYGYDDTNPNLFAERLDPENDGLSDDDGMQKLTVTVTHGERIVLTLEGYKTKRSEGV
jgi:prepilin-type N-terminal cleavage/methylation domain-containing protein